MSNLVKKETEKFTEAKLIKALNFDSRLKSKGTLYTYSKLIMKFIRWIDSNKVPREAVNKLVIIKYMEELKSLKYKNTSINNNLKAIKRFYKLLQSQDPNIINPVEGIEYFKEPKQTAKHKWLNEEQLKNIYSLLKKDTSERGLRNLAIFHILVMTGLRATELCELTFSDIIYQDDKPVEINVHGKGDKDRLVEFDEFVYAPIKAYHKTYGLCEGSNFFYTIPTNGQQERRPMNRFDIRYTIKSIGAKIGIDLTSHYLRHTYASHALKRGASLVAIKNRLGHSNINVTEQYYIIDEDKCLDYLKFDFLL